MKIMFLSQAAGFITSGNMSAFDVVSSEACKIVGDVDIVTNGNKVSCP